MAQALQWTQTNGFHSIEMEPLPDSPVMDVYDYFRSLGYKHRWSSKWDDMESGVTCYAMSNPSSKYPQYMIDIETENYCYQVFIQTEADMLAYWHQYGQASVTNTLTRILDLLVKGFRSWHGHGELDACRSCDPVQWRREREAMKP